MRPNGLHRWRLRIQLAFLAAFFVLLTLTVWPLGSVYLGAFLSADPLLAINSLASGVWKWPMVLAVAVLLMPLLLGRAFCGYVCPTGTIVELAQPRDRGGSRLSARWQRRLRALPGPVLVACAGLLLFASGSFLLIDPLATLTRSATVLLYPALDQLARLVGDALYVVPALRTPVDHVTAALSGRIILAEPLTYGLQLLFFLMLAAILGASFVEPRMWCRHICPLGALLGVVGRFTLWGRMVDEEACTSCGTCSSVCPLDAIADDYHTTDCSRCQLGLECADACPEGAIGLGWIPRRAPYSTSRRALVATGALSLTAGFFTFTGLARTVRHPRLIRPPGGRPEDEMLALCSRCGQCMKVCPTNVLQPALARTGLEGLFTPEMDFRVGYCDWSCNECGKLCPTGAIEPLDLPEKRLAVIGRAYIDRDTCLPWADYQTCLVCQELCPVPEKAVVIVHANVTTPDGVALNIGQPEVVAERCIGCGICENACPVPDEAAIVVRGV